MRGSGTSSTNCAGWSVSRNVSTRSCWIRRRSPRARRPSPRRLSGYKEINLRALKLLNPGGTLVTCSCSYHISEAAFAEIVYDAAIDARAHVTVVEKRMQARDHPVLLGVPETYYLKCFILRKLRERRHARRRSRRRTRQGGAGASETTDWTGTNVARRVAAQARRDLEAMARPAGAIRREPVLSRRHGSRVPQRRHPADARAGERDLPGES